MTANLGSAQAKALPIVKTTAGGMNAVQTTTTKPYVLICPLAIATRRAMVPQRTFSVNHERKRQFEVLTLIRFSAISDLPALPKDARAPAE